MRFISIEATVTDGGFVIDLNKPCKCDIGLVDIIIPNINQRNKDNNSIDIYCDQIDSTFDNPKRLLKRLYFESIGENQSCNIWEAKIINFQQIDSSDRYLNFRIRRTFEGTIPKFHKVDPRIFLTFALRDKKDERWTCS